MPDKKSESVDEFDGMMRLRRASRSTTRARSSSTSWCPPEQRFGSLLLRRPCGVGPIDVNIAVMTTITATATTTDHGNRDDLVLQCLDHAIALGRDIQARWLLREQQEKRQHSDNIMMPSWLPSSSSSFDEPEQQDQ